MPVLKQLRVDDVTYDTVGEASVTQVVSTGTKIATIAIDGTSTDLYAPSGGSSVDPATATPLMDGTAAVGTATKYAREDHVHPVDTSRQETLVSGTNIKTVNNESLLGSGNIPFPSVPIASTAAPVMDGTASAGVSDAYARADHVHPHDTTKQDTLVSGTTIKTVNGNSLLGSGDISVGGGGTSYTKTSIMLRSTGWSANAQTVSVPNVTEDSDVIIMAEPASASAYATAGIYRSAQGDGTLTFTCASVPSVDLFVKVMVFEGGAEVLSGIWYFNEQLTEVPTLGQDYIISFKSANDNYVKFTGTIARNKYRIVYYTNIGASDTPYIDGWNDQTRRTIEITGGDDAMNAEFIEWLKENATRVG